MDNSDLSLSKEKIRHDLRDELIDSNKSSYLNFSIIDRYWRTIGTAFCWAMFGVCTPVLNITALLISVLPFSKSRKRQLIRKSISLSSMFYLKTMRALKLITFSHSPAYNIRNYDKVVDNTENSTTKGKLIIANHPSLLDAFFILGMYPNLCCITKEELWKNPFTALLVRMADYIHNGSEDFIAEANTRLERGENILIFPEGTRNYYDDQLDFKRGAANIALLTQCNIVPIVIKCHPRTMEKGEKWYSIPETPSHFSIETLQTIKIEDHSCNNIAKTLQYRRLTQFLIEHYRPLLAKPTQAE